jgi:hypothetical protein
MLLLLPWEFACCIVTKVVVVIPKNNTNIVTNKADI